MKALTVLQPWASLIIHGEKTIDIRSWPARHRGPLLIHAGKSFPETAYDFCATQPIADTLRRIGVRRPSDFMPTLGKVIGAVQLTDCVPAEDAEALPDLAFADYRPGLWFWLLADARPFAAPIPFRGELGLFEVPDALLSGIE